MQSGPYARPIPCDADLPGAWPLAGGPVGFREVALHAHGRAAEILPVEAAAALDPDLAAAIARAAASRRVPGGSGGTGPVVMGVVNVTPDSFSDGGRHADAAAAVAHARRLAEAGAAILDVGGESTRPGAEPVAPDEEIARVVPVIEGIRAAGLAPPVSIDTRNAVTARAARAAGATVLNDVSALTHDPAMAGEAARFEAVCLMHAQGDPQTMQKNPHYDDVLLDVFDHLAGRVAAAEAAGIARERLIVDPGIGFGKTLDHNLALIRGLSLLHTLGCAVLLGASRKRFIGTLSGVDTAAERVAGSVAAALAGAGQGARIVRAHDVAAHVEALAVWRALAGARPGERDETATRPA
ncbi:MAG: dihydropteroate synthase [Paracoccaceae bacterium]